MNTNDNGKVSFRAALVVCLEKMLDGMDESNAPVSIATVRAEDNDLPPIYLVVAVGGLGQAVKAYLDAITSGQGMETTRSGYSFDKDGVRENT